MMPRIVAVILGLVAGTTVSVFMMLDLRDVLLAGGIGGTAFAAALTREPAQIVWAATTGATAFAVVALAATVIAGLIETLGALRAFEALRRDRSDLWNTGDWRDAFVRTAVSDRAEAIIAAITARDGPARFGNDAPLLTGLDEVWLDRLTLKQTLAPLAPLLLGFAAAAALFASIAGERWETTLAAGASAWVAIAGARFIGRLALTGAVAAAVESATAALRPLIGLYASGSTPSVGSSAETADLAAAIAHALSEPLDRLASAAEQLAAAARPPSRQQTIETTLAEIRAGIERLLEASEGPPD